MCVEVPTKQICGIWSLPQRVFVCFELDHEVFFCLCHRVVVWLHWHCEEPSGNETDEAEVPTVSPTPVPEVADVGVVAALPTAPGPSVAALPVPNADDGPVVHWPFIAGGARPSFLDGQRSQESSAKKKSHGINQVKSKGK